MKISASFGGFRDGFIGSCPACRLYEFSMLASKECLVMRSLADSSGWDLSEALDWPECPPVGIVTRSGTIIWLQLTNRLTSSAGWARMRTLVRFAGASTTSMLLQMFRCVKGMAHVFATPDFCLWYSFASILFVLFAFVR